MAKVMLAKREANDLFGTLTRMQIPKPSFKLLYARDKTKTSIRAVAVEVGEAGEVYSTCLKSEQDRYAKLDKDGKPKKDDNGGYIFDNPQQYLAAKKKLDDELRKVLDEEVEVEIHQIPYNVFVEAGLAGQPVMAVLFPMILDKPSEEDKQ
jgi:hypothetical protein